MDKEQILAFLAENPSIITEVLTDTHVEGYLATEQGKKFLQPKLDRYFNKGLDSWKEKNLNNLVNDEVSKRYPNETPEQKRIRELEQKLEAQQMEVLRKELGLKATSFATEFGVPSSLAGYFVGDTEESTRANLERFRDEYKTQLDSAIAEKTKGHTPTVPTQTQQGYNKNQSFSEFAKTFRNQ